jgi:hypothetical protein
MKEENNMDIDSMLKEASGKDLVLKTEPFYFRLIRRNTLNDRDTYSRDLAFIKDQKITAYTAENTSPLLPTQETANSISEATNAFAEQRKADLREKIIEKRSRNFLDVDTDQIVFDVVLVAEHEAIKAKVQYSIPTFPYQCLGLITENRKLVLFYADRSTPSFINTYVVQNELTEIEFLGSVVNQ